MNLVCNILRGINFAICYREGYISDLFPGWEVISFFAIRCIINGVINAKFESVSVLTNHIFFDFVSKGPNQKMS